MKKIRLFTLLILTLALAALLLSGCKKQDRVSAVALKDHTPEDVIEVELGKFDFGAYTLTVSYESGSTEEIALTEEMISSSDAFKFYQEGEHEITVLYSGAACTFKVSVKRASFDSLRFPENNVFTYDGTIHTIEVEGNIPANATVIYPAGNTFVNAGTYNVTAVVSCDGFVTERLSTTVTVECAKYDMSGVRFEEREFVYDGKAHTAQITGTLPKGVPAPTYSVNGTVNGSAIDVGTYVVVATFSNLDPNYEPIPPMQTILKITPADYNLPKLDLVFHSETGELISTGSKVYDGKKVVFSINEPSIVGKDVSVSYTVTDSNGNPITDQNGNGVMAFENAGVYTVQADILVLDGKNYNKVEPIVRTFKINKAKYDLSVFDFESKLVIYDGNEHSILLTIPDGHDVQPEDITYEYRTGSEIYVSGNDVGISEAGEYTVIAMIAVKNPNYERIKLDDMPSAALKIEKKTVDTSDVGFEGISHREYDGTVYAPSFKVLYDSEGVESDLLLYADREYFKRNESGVFEKVDISEAKNVGFYKYTLVVSVKDKNNYKLEGDASETTFSFEFEVYQKDIDIPEISFANGDGFVYDGTAKTPDVVYAPSDLWTVKVSYAKVIGMGLSNNLEMLPEGEIPVNAGAYALIATVSISDSVNYIFSSGSSTAEFTCEFAIDKMIIDASELFEDGASYLESNKDLKLESFERIDPEIKQYLSCLVLYITWDDGYGNSTVPPHDAAVHVGEYWVLYEIKIIDTQTQNVSFSNGKSKTSVNHRFSIVAKANFDSVGFPENNVFTYDGTAHTVEVVGNIPENATVTYLTENSFVNAGTYQVIAKVTCEGYNSLNLYATVTVERAKYDLSDFVFESKTVTYDGNEYNIILIIPEGHDIKPEDITYEYCIGGEIYVSGADVSVSDAGEYTVTAVITVKNPNYEQIKPEDMPTAVLKIEKKLVDISSVGFEGVSQREYDGTAYAPDFNVLYDSEGIESELLVYAEREYFKRNESGVFEKVDFEETKNAGFYRCTIVVSVKDKTNYTLLGDASETAVSFEFEVYKKQIDAPEVSFANGDGFVYNGKSQTPEVVYDPSELWTLKVSYAKLIGEGEGGLEMLSEGEIPVNAGSYVLIATVSVSDSVNYVFSSGSSTAEHTREFEIGKMVIDVSKLFENGASYEECNKDLKLRSFELIDPEIKKFLSCLVIFITWNDYGNWVSPPGDVAVYEGEYHVTYEIKIEDTQNAVFTDGNSVASVNHNFRIV